MDAAVRALAVRRQPELADDHTELLQYGAAPVLIVYYGKDARADAITVIRRDGATYDLPGGDRSSFHVADMVENGYWPALTHVRAWEKAYSEIDHCAPARGVSTMTGWMPPAPYH